MNAILAALAALPLIALPPRATAGNYSFQPTNTRFTAAGSLSIIAGGTTYNCTVNYSGRVNGFGLLITIRSVSFPDCPSVTPYALPWHYKTLTATTGFGYFGITTPTGFCNTALLFSDDQKGFIKIPLQNFDSRCTPIQGSMQSIQGSMQTTPAITIH